MRQTNAPSGSAAKQLRHLVAVELFARPATGTAKILRHFEEAITPARCAKERCAIGCKAGELAAQIPGLTARLLERETAGNEATPRVSSRAAS